MATSRDVPRILITSDGLKNEQVRSALVSRFGLPGEGALALVVTTASREWKARNKHAIEAYTHLEALGYAVEFIDFDTDGAGRLMDADLIYLSGGDPFYLLERIRHIGAEDELRHACARGALLVGSSAGALVLGPDLEHIRLVDPGEPEHANPAMGLGLCSLFVLPHYSRLVERDPGIEAVIRQFELTRSIRVERLDDGQAIVIDGERITRV